MPKEQSQEYLNNLRHSCAHLLAASVVKLWPQAKNAIGPSIENGFYQDFDMGGTKISEADFPRIEKTMNEILQTWDNFQIREVSVKQAKMDFSWNPYKLALIDEFAGQGKTITETKQGSFLDLCRGGHLKHPKKEIKHFKLLSVAGAYWRGSEKNQMLTRIYGTCWPSKAELEAYLKMREEAEKRDHKKLGKELELFVFSDTVGTGLPLWTPKGSVIRRELERFIVDEEIKRGYLHVYTPDIAKLDLYKKSGHYPYYKESMYAPIKIEEDEFMLRPMSCPHHFELYLARHHSYRELPMRIAELVKLYRYEQSGELSGLMRVRTFCLADAHIIARKQQAEAEISGALDLIDFVCKTLGLKLGTDYRYRLSLGNRKDDKKYFKDDKSWDEAEAVLRKVLKKRKAPFFEAENEAAFYGPKIDIQMKNVNGKEDTAFTVQYDFVMPKRFKLSYTNESGADEEPIVVHRSSIGAVERIIALLIERYAGAFPVWLSPVQAAVLPISDKQVKYAQKIVDELRENDIRVDFYNRPESIGKKIREAEMQKVPYMLIVGEKEMKAKSVAVRARGQKDLGSIKLEKFIDKIEKEIKSKSL
ncbi:MAG: threonine--tRNA ligase [Candidatus Doudnabacteria bacterium]|nr:threonine--tRNA ligase [Candidatus Doudnabacteria bacterium]